VFVDRACDGLAADGRGHGEVIGIDVGARTNQAARDQSANFIEVVLGTAARIR
jgi:hypothetical protein